jgi:transposase InsO family protein
VLAALRRAIRLRQPRPGLIHHTDRGGQYAGGDYRQVLQRARMEQSMSRPDNCYDNAFMESCFGTLKKDRTIPTCLHSRCRGPYNRHHLCLSVGAARTGELVPRPTEYQRRIRIMPRPQPLAAPPRT